MARIKPKYIPEPRVLDTFQVATRLGKSEGTFTRNRQTLEANGFPCRDEFLGGWDADAIERWFDQRSGLQNLSQASSENEWMEAVNGTH